MEQKKRYLVETLGYCLMCLRKKPTEDGSRIVVIDNLFSYLKLDARKFICNSMPLLQEAKLETLIEVELCQSCYKVHQRFSKAFREYEIAQMHVEQGIKSINQLLRESEENQGVKVGFHTAMAENVGLSILLHYQFADGIRKGTLESSSRKVKQTLPRVMVRKLQVKPVDASDCGPGPSSFGPLIASKDIKREKLDDDEHSDSFNSSGSVNTSRHDQQQSEQSQTPKGDCNVRMKAHNSGYKPKPKSKRSPTESNTLQPAKRQRMSSEYLEGRNVNNEIGRVNSATNQRPITANTANLSPTVQTKPSTRGSANRSEESSLTVTPKKNQIPVPPIGGSSQLNTRKITLRKNDQVNKNISSKSSESITPKPSTRASGGKLSIRETPVATTGCDSSNNNAVYKCALKFDRNPELTRKLSKMRSKVPSTVPVKDNHLPCGLFSKDFTGPRLSVGDGDGAVGNPSLLPLLTTEPYCHLMTKQSDYKLPHDIWCMGVLKAKELRLEGNAAEDSDSHEEISDEESGNSASNYDESIDDNHL